MGLKGTSLGGQGRIGISNQSGVICVTKFLKQTWFPLGVLIKGLAMM